MDLCHVAFVLLSLVAISEFSHAISVGKVVFIKNDLGSGLVLGYHCASANDDLGFRLLPPGEDWGFQFNTDAFGTTLFHCSFNWVGGERRSFAVYDDNQHHYMCTQCHWSIHTNGTCLYSSAINQVGCYPWAPNMGKADPEPLANLPTK